MIKIIGIVALLLLAAWIGLQLHADPGYVLVVFHHWSIESTLWVAVLLGLLILGSVYIIVSSIAWIRSLPHRFAQWRLHRRAHAAQEKTRQGLVAFNEGDWRVAQKKLINALPDAELPLINYLTAARAAQEMGDLTQRDHYLSQAQQHLPDAHMAVEFTQAQLQIAQHQWEQALATLQHLMQVTPHHPYVLKLLMTVYLETQDWPALLAIIPALKHTHVIDENTLVNLTRQAYTPIIENLMLHERTRELHDQMDKLPKFLKNDVPLHRLYIHYLIKHKAYDEAQTQTRRLLRQTCDPKLLRLYVQLPSSGAQLSFVESLLKTHGPSAPLYMCLAHLSFSERLWGQANLYIEKSIALKPSIDAYALLGRLMEQSHDLIGACAAYRNMVKIYTYSGME